VFVFNRCRMQKEGNYDIVTGTRNLGKGGVSIVL
jgi:hypothetical protein